MQSSSIHYSCWNIYKYLGTIQGRVYNISGTKVNKERVSCKATINKERVEKYMSKKPFLGCAYYPEDWDEDQIPYDIAKMKEAGITCARIGEFAWRKMEPRRGQYEFGWLHKVVDALFEAGIDVVMGTPTATPPIWLSQEYPDVTLINKNGVRTNHGGRRHCCSSNPHYLEASYEIVHAMGKEFGKDPAIIGWQLDNEIYTRGEGCVCKYCLERFHRELKEKYGTIEELNRQWNLNLFSQAYDTFEEIPAAINAWHNPHICLEWGQSHHNANIDFMHKQAEILKQYTDAPIGTDMMPINGMDYEKMTEPLDIVQFNHYNTPENLYEVVMWFNYLRTLKDRPFWNTETATTWNGSAAITQYLKPEGYCRVNSWLPVALGGEANMYWLFRQHWAGHELIHGYVISPEGRPCHTFGEIQQTSAEFEKAGEMLSGTKVVTPVALHFTSLNWNLLEHQPVVKGLEYCKEVAKIHKALLNIGVCPDVIGATHSLEGYKLLVSPLMMTLEDKGLAERIVQWVKEGGVWVAGPLTDVRNSIGAHYKDRAMGVLEELLGIRLDYGVPTDGSILKTAWWDGVELTANRYVECYSQVEEVWASVVAGHSSLNGETVIGKVSWGKGAVILCGTLPSDPDLDKLYRLALAEADITPYDTTETLVAVDRQGESGNCLVLCEVANEEATIYLDSARKDLLTGIQYDAGIMHIAPYGVHVLV